MVVLPRGERGCERPARVFKRARWLSRRRGNPRTGERRSSCSSVERSRSSAIVGVGLRGFAALRPRNVPQRGSQAKSGKAGPLSAPSRGGTASASASPMPRAIASSARCIVACGVRPNHWQRARQVKASPWQATCWPAAARPESGKRYRRIAEVFAAAVRLAYRYRVRTRRSRSFIESEYRASDRYTVPCDRTPKKEPPTKSRCAHVADAKRQKEGCKS